MSWFSPAQHVLLTGAGFTSNFGGYLANQMWAAIFKQPEIRAEPHLRNKMLNFLNYEVVYDLVLNQAEYSELERRSFLAAIRRAYEQMHGHICDDRDPEWTARATAVCSRFLSRFAGKDRQRGFFYTLNQDLFVEQFFREQPPSIPGLRSTRWFNGRLGPTLDPETRVNLPDTAQVDALAQSFWEKSTGGFAYIKLHGSLGWVGHEGTDVLVIGQTKSRLIEQEPLLRWNLALFREVVRRPDTHLITIGYGFQDEHINGIIADAIRDNGLRLCVVAPFDAETFHFQLMSVHDSLGPTPRGHEIWSGLYYYGQALVTDFYHPQHTRLTPRGEEFFKDIGLG